MDPKDTKTEKTDYGKLKQPPENAAKAMMARKGKGGKTKFDSADWAMQEGNKQ